MEWIRFSERKPTTTTRLCVVMDVEVRNTSMYGEIVENSCDFAHWNGEHFLVWDINRDDHVEIEDPHYWMELEYISDVPKE